MRLGTRLQSSGCASCNESHPRPINHCDDRRVISVTKAGDDVIITLSDCTYLRAPISVVDDSVRNDTLNTVELSNAIKTLQDKFAKLDAALEPLTGLDGSEKLQVLNETYP